VNPLYAEWSPTALCKNEVISLAQLILQQTSAGAGCGQGQARTVSAPAEFRFRFASGKSTAVSRSADPR
jgi:hypothetical protein